jgi:hypothetical protein
VEAEEVAVGVAVVAQWERPEKLAKERKVPKGLLGAAYLLQEQMSQAPSYYRI